MPRKNSRKIYIEKEYYHLYNRGVNKQEIFLDDRDYKVFLHFLKECLSPPGVRPWGGSNPGIEKEIKLLAFCLLPNHFHLLVRQETLDGITKLTRWVNTNYVMYFNKRYDREGPLFNGVYRAVRVETDEQLLHLSRYIHLNPFEAGEKNFRYPYSSYDDYLGEQKADWVHPEQILSFFKTAQRRSLADHHSYQSFVEDYKKSSESHLEGLTLDRVRP